MLESVVGSKTLRKTTTGKPCKKANPQNITSHRAVVVVSLIKHVNAFYFPRITTFLLINSEKPRKT